MTCREAQRLLSDELGNSLKHRARRLLADHLAACAACREEQRLLAATRRLLSAYGAIACPSDFTFLAARLPAHIRKRALLHRFMGGLAIAGTAAALALTAWQWQRPARAPLPIGTAPRVVIRDVADVAELHRAFVVQQSLGPRDGLVFFAPQWADRAP
jgi:predicted anti-sigma-YlaC factor YlaD